MRSTKEQSLRNPDIRPTSDVIAEALGEANNAYMKFVNELSVCPAKIRTIGICELMSQFKYSGKAEIILPCLSVCSAGARGF
jgi:hypothetical protein